MKRTPWKLETLAWKIYTNFMLLQFWSHIQQESYLCLMNCSRTMLQNCQKCGNILSVMKACMQREKSLLQSTEANYANYANFINSVAYAVASSGVHSPLASPPNGDL
ncbi:hypothetical protein PR048_025163 [Dryococelus australis]|uniref:Uncharacterized protein n=1 Tax=Dryococelus australis TaxID=614101 RepID=A0ABQ9GQK7_9NEOP|nr:hypothetical protein PR048_025163 [Dryococelus australis]